MKYQTSLIVGKHLHVTTQQNSPARKKTSGKTSAKKLSSCENPAPPPPLHFSQADISLNLRSHAGEVFLNP